MSSMFEQAQQAVGTQMKKLRWALGLNGALSIVLGVVIIVWPNISLFSLVIVFGAYALVRGVFGLVAAIATPIPQGRGWLIVSSLAGIAVGVLVFLRTDMSALALLYVIGAYAITLGVIAMVAVAIRREDRLYSLSGAAPGAAARGTRWLTRFGGSGSHFVPRDRA